MNAAEVLEKMGETLGSSATVKCVFGEPIHFGEPNGSEGKIVVPVAKVAYGFGAGGGHGPGHGPAKHDGGSEEQAEGGGGGGGMRAFPAGALEITRAGTRFVPYTDFRWIAGAFAAGAVLASLFLRRK